MADRPGAVAAGDTILPLPPGWEASRDPAPGTRLVAREPLDGCEPSRFRANVVITEVTTAGMSFSEWQTGTEELMPRLLTDYLVVDLERLEIDGQPGGRRLAHHCGPGGEALTMEQWFTQSQGMGHTLTFTVETWRYDDLADLGTSLAARWRPSGGGTDAAPG